MALIQGPCKGCADRTVGCHSKCEVYKAYQVSVEDAREKQYTEISTRHYEVESLLNRRRKAVRSK